MTFDSIEKGLKELLHPTAADGAPCSSELYRYASGDMLPGEAARFEIHLRECQLCRDDLSAIESLSGGKLVSLPARPRRRLNLAYAAAAAVLAALVGYWLVPSDKDHAEDGLETPFRPKSGYDIQLAVQRDGRRFAGKSGDLFRAGDLIGFFYTAPEDTWPVILFGDAKGEITRVFPKEEPIRKPAGIELPLPVSAVLEKGSDCEWIAAFFAKVEPDLQRLEGVFKRAIEGRESNCELKTFDVPDTFVEVLVLRKESTSQ